LPERLTRKIELLREIKERVGQFIALSNPGSPDHFSGLVFLCMTETPESNQAENSRDVEQAVFAKGSVSDIQNMFAKVFQDQPGLFALIQEAVVLHVYKNYDPAQAMKLLKNPIDGTD
jgi:hypothetical protein